jgi:hypothetical protein
MSCKILIYVYDLFIHAAEADAATALAEAQAKFAQEQKEAEVGNMTLGLSTKLRDTFSPSFPFFVLFTNPSLRPSLYILNVHNRRLQLVLLKRRKKPKQN